MIDLILEDLRQETPEVLEQFPEDILRSAISTYVSEYQEKRTLPKLSKQNSYTAALRRSVKKHVKLPRVQRDRLPYVAPKEKICTKCEVDLPIAAFSKKKDGRHLAACKACIYETYYKPSALKRLRKAGKKTKSEHIRVSEEHKRNKRREARNRWRKKARKDPKFRTIRNIRNRLRTLISKRGSSYQGKVALLGCTRQELYQHLENQFQPGMTWGNYGEWHIDHIQPLCSFDLTNDDELKVATNFKNLRPLWAEENIAKSLEDRKLKK